MTRQLEVCLLKAMLTLLASKQRERTAEAPKMAPVYKSTFSVRVRLKTPNFIFITKV